MSANVRSAAPSPYRCRPCTAVSARLAFALRMALLRVCGVAVDLPVSSFMRLRYMSKKTKSLVQGEVDSLFPDVAARLPLSERRARLLDGVPTFLCSTSVPCFPYGIACLRVQTNFDLHCCSTAVT